MYCIHSSVLFLTATHGILKMTLNHCS